MSKVYERADEAVAKVIDEAKRTIHHVLRLCEVTCDALFVAEYATDDDEQELIPALDVGGYPAAACVRVTSPKDRAKGMADFEMIIDLHTWERLDDGERLALIDHELTHIQVKAERGVVTWDPVERTLVGDAVLDDLGRPKLKMRKHDAQIGIFFDVAKRHGEASPDVAQVRRLIGDNGQFCWDFDEPPTAESMGRVLADVLAEGRRDALAAKHGRRASMLSQ